MNARGGDGSPNALIAARVVSADRRVPAHERVQRPQRPTARAVKPRQPEERADGIDALNAGIHEIDDRQPQRNKRSQRDANRSRMALAHIEQAERRGYGGQFWETASRARACVRAC